jgi:hypothetical protein
MLLVNKLLKIAYILNGLISEYLSKYILKVLILLVPEISYKSKT